MMLVVGVGLFTMAFRTVIIGGSARATACGEGEEEREGEEVGKGER